MYRYIRYKSDTVITNQCHVKMLLRCRLLLRLLQVTFVVVFARLGSADEDGAPPRSFEEDVEQAAASRADGVDACRSRRADTVAVQA